MKKVDSYQCEHCGAIYPTEKEANACEASHKTKLRVIDMQFEPDPDNFGYGFPKLILVEVENYSGLAAEYRLVEEGSVEGFEPYHPEEYYEQDWDTDDG